MKSPVMADDWKRPARGFDEISSVFLSSAGSDRSVETVPDAAPSLSSSPLQFAVFCCMTASPVIESFFACNLAVEIAKNNQTVTLIDYGFERSIVRYLMGCPNPAQDIFRPESTVRPEYKIESVMFHQLPEITLVLPVVPKDRNLPGRTAERIFSEEKVRKSNVILINSPLGSDETAVPESLTQIERAIIFMDGKVHSMVKAYSLIKRLCSSCSHYLIGAVAAFDEQSEPVLENISKLQKTIFKHLLVGLELRVVTVPLDREATISMQVGKPLALMDSSISSSSASAIRTLGENLLRNQ